MVKKLTMISSIHNWTAKKTELSDNLNPENLQLWQQKKLEKIIDYTKRNTKFYKNKLPNTNNLTDLPFTLPNDLANNPFDFLAIPQNEVIRITTLSNSGTTNLRKRIFYSKNDLERTKDFFAVGMSDIVEKDDIVKILISNKTENSLGSLLHESLLRIEAKPEISGIIKNVEQAINICKNADCIIGMPIELLYMSKTAPELRPKTVLLAADYIPQSVINSIKETWNCEVFSHYGHTEFGYGCAVDCKYHNGLHLRHIDHIFEIIDIKTNKPAKIGEIGEIVITTLSNEAMPLIRYRTGNIAKLTNIPCNCGCLLPRFVRIEGKIMNNIFINNDEFININQLDEILFENKYIKGINANLNINKKILHLLIDVEKKIDLSCLISILPAKLDIQIKYDKVDPFFRREKRRIHLQ